MSGLDHNAMDFRNGTPDNVCTRTYGDIENDWGFVVSQIEDLETNLAELKVELSNLQDELQNFSEDSDEVSG